MEVHTSYFLPSSDLFHRDQPASQEGPPEMWEAITTIIDWGGALFETAGQEPTDRPLRRAVMAALLRRVLITAEGVRCCLAAGLVESALVLLRTLLDLQLNMALVSADPTDRMTKRLAAYHYYGYQRHGQDILGDRELRQGILANSDALNVTKDVARSYARFLEGELFDDVRDQVRASRFWHGFDRPGDAFASVGASDDYLMAYDTANFFVHGVNVDHDFSGIEGGQLRVKPMVERDPAPNRVHLTFLAIKLHEIYKDFLQDQGTPEAFTLVPEEDADTPEGTIQLNAVDGLTSYVLQHFGKP